LRRSAFPFNGGFDLAFKHSCCTLCWLAFVQDSLIKNQNHRHKTDKIIARTLLFSKNQKLNLPKRLLKNIDLICAKLLAEKRQLLYTDQNAC